MKKLINQTTLIVFIILLSSCSGYSKSGVQSLQNVNFNKLAITSNADHISNPGNREKDLIKLLM